MQQVLLALTNVSDADNARYIARALVEQQIAACVNIMPAIQSVYRWQGAVEEGEEWTLLIKTTQARYAELERLLQVLHPYELPELIAFPVTNGLPAYLAWVENETKRDVDV